MGWKKNRREGRSERRSGSHAESGFVGSFRDPLGGSKGIRGVKIMVANKRKSGLTL